MPSERWQHRNVNFTQILVELLVKSVVSNLIALCANGDHSKMGKETFFSPKFACLLLKNY